MTNHINQPRRRLVLGAAALSTGLLPLSAFAADPFKVGLILPMSGPVSYTHLTLPTKA